MDVQPNPDQKDRFWAFLTEKSKSRSMVKKGVQMPRGSSFARPSDPIQVTQPVIPEKPATDWRVMGQALVEGRPRGSACSPMSSRGG